MRGTLAATVAALVVGGLGGVPAHANLVTNPGFDADGDLITPAVPSGWSLGALPAVQDAGADDTFPRSTPNAAFFGDGTVYQDIPTSSGTTYSITFWVAVDDGITYTDPGATFDASFGGTDLFNGVPLVPTDLALGTYTEYAASVTATGASTPLSFTGITTGDLGDWYLDDVSVTATSMPEPGMDAMFLAGVLGLLTLVRLRQA